MATKIDYIIYADESDSKGDLYSNFYGGLIIPALQEKASSDYLNAAKDRLNLHNELKWERITQPYENKYKEFIGAFFDLADKGEIKLRIMFTDNKVVAVGLTDEHRQNKFLILYYQFIRYAFGLRFANLGHRYEKINVRLRFDELPDRTEAHAAFTGYIRGLPDVPEWKSAAIDIPPDGFAEVDSKAHVLMQGLDIVLGGMSFHMNQKSLKSPDGKRTKAKAAISDYILERVRSLVPGFDPCVSTPKEGSGYWGAAYRHWCFTPKNHKAR